MKFNNINELSKTYEVKASFYKKNDTTFRNCADIIRKGEIVNICVPDHLLKHRKRITYFH